MRNDPLAPINPKIKVPPPGPRAREVMAADVRTMSTCYTRYVPLVVKRAAGCGIEDVDGNRFLDFTAGIAVNNCGHCHPSVVYAARRQVGQLMHMCTGDYYNEPASKLATKLCGLMPFPARVFFTNSGTESVECAIKLSRWATGRQRIIAFQGSFHGRTMGSVSLTASKPIQREGFGPLLPGVEHCKWNDIGAIEDMFRTTTPGMEVAAIFTEVIQGEGGYREAKPGFLSSLRILCSRYGIMLVVDEVQSGFGRTGDMFAFQAHGIVPDMVCCAKGLGGGLPLGALIAKRDVMEWPEGAHGSTFGGNPVSCAAALASLEWIQQRYMRNAREVGEHMLSIMDKKWRGAPGLVEFGGRGLMLRVTFESDGLRDAIIQEAFKRGLILLGCGKASIRICPPLCLTKKEASIGMGILREAYDECRRPKSRARREP